jgi:hypothetical protein
MIPTKIIKFNNTDDAVDLYTNTVVEKIDEIVTICKPEYAKTSAFKHQLEGYRKTHKIALQALVRLAKTEHNNAIEKDLIDLKNKNLL